LKFAGERGQQIPAPVRAVVGVSVPCDLKHTAYHLDQFPQTIYRNRLLATLKRKLELKKAFPPQAPISVEKIRQIRNFRKFDDLYTAPAHGFTDAEDYWKQCSSKQFIPAIERPTLLINAQDDPLLPAAAYPGKEARQNENVQFVTPRFGGHVGFVSDLFCYRAPWHETYLLRFLQHCAE
jgi:predicted alpha/beta-fold hydrolase